MRVRRSSRNRSVRVLSAALAEVRVIAEAAIPRETGGILLGHRGDDSEVIVRRFLEVPDEQAGPTQYRRRHAAAQAALDEVLALQPPGAVLGYVGEWHSHPGREGPNNQDVQELRECARRTRHAIALIVLSFEGQSWIPRAWAARGRRCRPVEAIEVPDKGSEEADPNA